MDKRIRYKGNADRYKFKLDMNIDNYLKNKVIKQIINSYCN